MPGLVVFNRRWSVGSDDLVVPGLILLLLHLAWLIVMAVILGIVEEGFVNDCRLFHTHILGYLVILTSCILVEGCVVWVAMKGSILYTEPRDPMQYLLYIRLVILLVEFVWSVVGVVWIIQHYNDCPSNMVKKSVLGIIICDWVIFFSVLITAWCVFDTAGRNWVKLKRCKREIKRTDTHVWRTKVTQRLTMEAYEASWEHRCKLLCCCAGVQDNQQHAFQEIAHLLSEFFIDVDLVPSDVVAGLVLLRQQQKHQRQMIVGQHSNDTYQFLSGVPINPRTKFVQLSRPEILEQFKEVVYYMRYALAAYGWPLYIYTHPGAGACQLLKFCSCCCCQCCRNHDDECTLEHDNCCQCNLAGLKRTLYNYGLNNTEVTYANFHSAVNETCFFVSIDHDRKAVVVTIRGTLSLQDCLTDLTADAESFRAYSEDFPHDWYAHRGMLESAVYVKNKLEELLLLDLAFSKQMDEEPYGLIISGHSLGAGTAAILAILLKKQYPNLRCFPFSPPGGLLSKTAVDASRSYITSTVVGKDVVPRMGLPQMEHFRFELLKMLKRSTDPKWRIIAYSLPCCCLRDPYLMPDIDQSSLTQSTRDLSSRSASTISINIPQHLQLYPPGRMIHVVRNHPREKWCGKMKPRYQALWVKNEDFSEILVSPAMMADHFPDQVMHALEEVLRNTDYGLEDQFEASNKNKLKMNDSVQIRYSHETLSHTSEEDLLDRACPRVESSLSWEYNSRDELVAGPRKGTPSIKENKSRASLITKSAQTLDPTDPDWQSSAPLAESESLSESDSVYSIEESSKALSIGTIQTLQSTPDSTTLKSDPGYCYYVSTGVSNELLNASGFPSEESTPHKNQMTTTATIEKIPSHTSSARQLYNGVSDGSPGEKWNGRPASEELLSEKALRTKLPPQPKSFTALPNVYNSPSFSEHYRLTHVDDVNTTNPPRRHKASKLKTRHLSEPIPERAKYEPNLIPKPPRLYANRRGTSSGNARAIEMKEFHRSQDSGSIDNGEDSDSIPLTKADAQSVDSAVPIETDV
ncbi:sn1-specific diacylglycerol lipase alpha-like isoform X2 [Branchiostoma floridae]|uniref:Diacylglycerol lipase-alpha n=1 Tax=Branchiostoma floridae TaxID=7739 RepID=A0A9J7KJS9_BRAFL|nr:sn1-specific diacylglycerol lipase alpha-like isoform X2 [Branchiostoma floridae]